MLGEYAGIVSEVSKEKAGIERKANAYRGKLDALYTAKRNLTRDVETYKTHGKKELKNIDQYLFSKQSLADCKKHLKRISREIRAEEKEYNLCVKAINPLDEIIERSAAVERMFTQYVPQYEVQQHSSYGQAPGKMPKATRPELSPAI